MRIYVTGPTGSGKTTLATLLSGFTKAPLYSQDDIHWVRDPSGDFRREPQDRLRLLEKLTLQDAWIIEGVQFKWADTAMERADMIVVLDVPRWRNVIRIMRRFAARRLSSSPGRRGTLMALGQEMGWYADYHSYEREMLFAKVARWSGKVHVVRGRRDMLVIGAMLPSNGRDMAA